MRRKYGIHPFGHDSAVVSIDHANKTIQAISLERITRFKHDYRFVKILFDSYFSVDCDTEIVCAMKEVSPGMALNLAIASS